MSPCQWNTVWFFQGLENRLRELANVDNSGLEEQIDLLSWRIKEIEDAKISEDDEEEIVIDFDELMSDMEATTPEEEAEEIPADAESPIDREELLDAEPVALEEEEALEEDLEEALENLTEEDLSSLLEEVDVDIKSMHPNNGHAGSTAGDRAENAELVAIAAALDEEQEKTKELEEQNAMLNETVQKNNETLAKAKQIIQEMKSKMNDVNLLNARLFYTNKILESNFPQTIWYEWN